MKIRLPFIHFFNVAILLLLLSCSNDSIIAYSELEENEAINAYLARNASIQTFYGDADVTLNYYDAGKLENQKFNATIMWNANDSLAVEMNYGVLGINLADVAKLFVGKNNYVFVTRDNLFLTGLRDDGYLNQLFRIDISLSEWAPKLFMGILFENAEDYQQTLKGNILNLENQSERIVFRSDIMMPGQYVYQSGNGNEFSIMYEERITSGAYVFPKRITYYNKSDQSETIIEYNEIKVNKALPKKGFEVKIPSQMEQIIYD